MLEFYRPGRNEEPKVMPVVSAVAAALALIAQVAPTQLSGVVLNPKIFRTAEALRAWTAQQPPGPTPPHNNGVFRLDLPVIPASRTDLAGLQNPASWRYIPEGRQLLVSIDLGAVTPANLSNFETAGLFEAPPLRTLYFVTANARDGRNQTSYALAIPASAADHGKRSGDLPDGFTPPLSVSLPVNPRDVGALTSFLRLRVEGELRMIAGRSVICGVYTGTLAYPNSPTGAQPVSLRECLAPAVLTRVALVRQPEGKVLREWVRGDRDPTEESKSTAVLPAN